MACAGVEADLPPLSLAWLDLAISREAGHRGLSLRLSRCPTIPSTPGVVLNYC
jgi:hypothetical protein